MAATFEFIEDNGTAAGTPAKGTTRTAARTDVNWKNIDDSTTAYSSSPIVAGGNSFPKNQAGKFTGTFNEISAGLFAHTAGTFGAGLALVGKVTSTYTTPSTGVLGGSSSMTSAIAIASGLAVLFAGTGPENATPVTNSTANPTYSQFLVTQLQTTGAAAAGDTATVTLTLQYNEN